MNRARLVAGVDEAGRGPLAGPVVAAAVVLDPGRSIPGIADSKLLTAKRREKLALLIRDQSVAWAIGVADVDEIDHVNILQATMLAMARAVEGLRVLPFEALIDGNRCPRLSCRVRAIVGGDRSIASISAASIIAKTVRDAMLLEFDERYPGYGFARHKGYATPEHLAALARHGPCPIHRRSFAPVVQREMELGR